MPAFGVRQLERDPFKEKRIALSPRLDLAHDLVGKICNSSRSCVGQENSMKVFIFLFSTGLFLATISAIAGAAPIPSNFVTLAQGDGTVGPDGVAIGERGRDYDRIRNRDHDRNEVRFDKDRDRGCRVTGVEGHGEIRTIRRCGR
jgi:hypothetical protein